MYKPNKDLGQNFLMDNQIIQDLISQLNIQPDDKVVEIGPGLGAITEPLVQRLFGEENHLYAVEIDNRFTAKLGQMYTPYLNVHVILADILDWLPKFEPDTHYKIIGSLPYYITTPIVHSIVKKRKLAELVIILIQKEVAEKISKKSPDTTYISSLVQTFFNVEFLSVVGREKFEPKPNVDGGILKLTKKQARHIMFGDTEKYEGFLKRAYSNPRKMLNKVFTLKECAKAGIDSQLRAQNYNAEDWVKFFKALNT